MNDIIKKVDDLFPEVCKLRRYFHQHPEVSKCEFNTANKITDELKKIGINSIRVGETGVYGEIIGKKPGKTIILRADIDALPINENTDLSFKSVNPNVMHACGHDVHTSALLGAAKVLHSLKDKFNGKVKLMFQQAEEIGYGAKVFIKEGYLQGVDGAFGVHISSDIHVNKIACVKGANNASVDYLKITIKGKSAHICKPKEAVDALSVLVDIVHEIKKIPNNEKLLIGIGKISSGTQYNIISDEGTIEGTIRCFDNQLREKVKKQIADLANEISKKYNAQIETTYKDFTCALINDDEMTDKAITVASKLFGKENVITSKEPSFSGDDFAELQLLVPGTYAYVGTHNDDPNTKLPHHNDKLVIDEEAIRVAILMHICFAIDFLNK